MLLTSDICPVAAGFGNTVMLLYSLLLCINISFINAPGNTISTASSLYTPLLLHSTSIRLVTFWLESSENTSLRYVLSDTMEFVSFCPNIKLLSISNFTFMQNTGSFFAFTTVSIISTLSSFVAVVCEKETSVLRFLSQFFLYTTDITL